MPFIVSAPVKPPRLPTNSQYWSRTVAPKSAPQVPSLNINTCSPWNIHSETEAHSSQCWPLMNSLVCFRIQSGQSLSIFSHEVSRRIMVRSKYFMVFIVFRLLDQVSILCQLSFMVDMINTRMNTKTLQTVSIFKQKCKFLFWSAQTFDPPTTLTRPHPTRRSHLWGQIWYLNMTWERGRLGMGWSKYPAIWGLRQVEILTDVFNYLIKYSWVSTWL